MRFFKKAYNYIAHHGLIWSFFYLAKLLLLYCRRLFGGHIYLAKKINKSYKMYLNLKDQGISKPLYLYGTREKDQVYIVQSAVKGGMNVLDIGANIGYYVLLEADIIGDSGKVYAFEPHPNNFAMLKRNVELNNFLNKVELYQMGMSDQEGVFNLFISNRSNLHTLNPEYSKSYTKKEPFKGSMRIEVADITKFLREKKNIDFIRMDIEGHEVEVLNGLYRGLDDLRIFPSILFETHLHKYNYVDHNMKDTLGKLFAKGYNVEAIISNNELRSPLNSRGYKPKVIIKTDQVYRGIYHNVDPNDVLHFVCDTGGIRAIFLIAKTQYSIK